MATRRVQTALLAGVVLLAGACGADAEPETVAEDAAPDTVLFGAQAVAIAGFTYDTAQRAPWTTRVTAPARVVLDPERHHTFGSITEGRVTRVLVRVGDVVRPGDVLVTIHSHEIMDARSRLVRAESQQRAARAEHDAAELALARAQRLLAARAMGQADVERATVAAAAARARFEEAAAEVERAHGLIEHLIGEGTTPDAPDPHDVLIRATMAGVVVARTVVPGTVVLPGDPLVAVADPRALLLELRLTDRQLDGLAPGAPLTFTLVGEPADAPAGRAVVARISPMADEATRTTMLFATITDAPPGTRAERFATAQLTGRAGEETLRVPASAVQSLAGDTVVLVAEPRGEGVHVSAVRVRVGRRDASYAEILAGLEPGRVVIARGATIARAELLKRRDGEGGE